MFLSIQNNLKIRDSSWNFYGSEIRRGIFGGLNFGPGIFLGLFEALGIFLGFDFCLHSIIPVTWNLELPRHNFQQKWKNIVFKESCKSLSCFWKVLMGKMIIRI